MEPHVQPFSVRAFRRSLFGPSAEDIYGDVDTHSELPHTAEKQRKKQRRDKERSSGARSTLPPEWAKVMGEANLLFVDGKYEEACGKLLQVVKACPTDPEAYGELGLIYEDLGQPETAAKFHFSAAALKKTDADLWLKVADMFRELDDKATVAECYRRLKKLRPDDIDLLSDLAQLYAEMGEFDNAATTMNSILTLMPADVHTARELARLYMSQNSITRAINVLEKTWQAQKALSDVTASEKAEIVHNLTEMYLLALKYEEIEKVFHEFVEDCFDMDTPFELVSNIAIALILSSKLEKAEEHLEDLRKASPKHYGDLYLNVADAFVTSGLMGRAAEWYRAVLGSTEFDNASVWLRLAHCLAALGEDEAAINFYQKVLNVHPDRDAMVALSGLLSKLGRLEEAMQTIERHTTPSTTLENFEHLESAPLTPGLTPSVSNADVPIIVQKALLLCSQREYGEFVAIALPLALDRSRLTGELKRKTHGRAPHVARGRKDETSILDVLPPDRYFSLIYKLALALEHIEKYAQAIEVVKLHLDFAKDISDHPFTSEQRTVLEWILTDVALKAGAHAVTVESLKSLIKKQPDNLMIYHKFMELLRKEELLTDAEKETLTLPMLKRVAKSHPDATLPKLTIAHLSLAKGSYAESLKLYKELFAQHQVSPMLSLCIGTAYLLSSMNRNLAARHYTVARAFAFMMNYYNLRGECPESLYNLARTFQHLSLYHLAVPLYEKVLIKYKSNDLHGLCLESAYNLALIYKDTGNLDLYHQTLVEHIVV